MQMQSIIPERLYSMQGDAHKMNNKFPAIIRLKMGPGVKLHYHCLDSTKSHKHIDIAIHDKSEFNASILYSNLSVEHKLC